ncbi:hypothetical protein [Nitrosophilus labii]|uniref:hypothetical protein n=1 Tax=Nitrosophilus labii TaxID=2706014 RepID=UPI001657028D|nr:hypothetical protein [Nitrosophilus labii]
MSDFEKLKNIDIEELYSKTFIARKHLRAILNKDFSKFDRLKALGFVKIIEREFDFDLSELKKEIESYFSQKSEKSVKDLENIEKKELNSNKSFQKSKKFPIFALVIIAMLFIALLFFTQQKSLTTQNLDKKDDKEKMFLEKNETSNKNEDKNETQKSIESKKSDENKTFKQEDLEEKSLLKAKSTKEEKPKEAVLPSIILIPKQKIWVGIIYLDDYSKKNYLTSSAIELNTTRDQLIVTGHGYLEIEKDGNVTEYSDKNRLRFIYKAGDLEKIDLQTFKKYNRGKSW